MSHSIKIHNIGNYMLRNYLLETTQGWIALDSGYAGGFEAYKKRLAKLTPLDQVKYVFLTHSHNDHAGFLAELLTKSGAHFVAHENSLPRLASGVNVMPDGTGFTSRMGVAMHGMMKHSSYPPVVPDENAIILKSEADQPFLVAGLPIRIAESWDKIIALNPSRIYPSHGNPFPVGDLTKFRRRLDDLTLFYPKKD